MTTTDPRGGKNLVHRIERGEDPREVHATTYQMRNFFKQLRDALPGQGALDVMNYCQHMRIAEYARAGQQVLDLCCGRGLLLPFLRYHNKTIGGYTGVDIEPGNARWQTHRVTDEKPLTEVQGSPTLEDYYPFPVRFVHADVSDLTPLHPNRYHLIVYTSSLEHMHHDVGLASLTEARKVAAPGATMFLTTPNTPEGQDGYATQYRAHVYEWKLSELIEGLDATGWVVSNTWGLYASWSDLLLAAHRNGYGEVLENQALHIPRPFLVAVWSPSFPEVAKEIGLVCRPKEEG